MAGMPHTTVPATIPFALRTIRTASTPRRVTGRHLEANGLARGEGPHMVGLLRAVGFIDAAGRPTNLWMGYQTGPAVSGLLADALRIAYAPLFDEFPAAQKEVSTSLARVIRSSTDYSDHHVFRTIESFQALCRFADFTAGSTQSPPPGPLRLSDQTRDSCLSLQAMWIREAQECIRHGLCRAAHVSAWNGFVGLAMALLSANDFAAVRMLRPTWKGSTAEELAMRTPGAQLLGMLEKLELCDNDQVDQLPLLLQRRNDCAHPTSYDPTLAETLDYVSAVESAGKRLLSKPSLARA